MSFDKKQSGDTIIEVLVAMSVIGLVLGAAFGIANRSVQIGQSAQERTEALKIAETQLEIFKSEYLTNDDIKDRLESQPFCLVNHGLSAEIKETTDSECLNINGGGQAGLFSISIIPPNPDPFIDPSGAYEFKITWERIGATASNDEDDKNKVSLYFKPGSL